MNEEAQDLSDKVYVVTGANSGIGFAAAKDFSRRGATTVLLCRNQERGEKALAEIKRHSGNDNLKLVLADFSSLADVSRAGKEILAEFPVIDVLCNNAGGTNSARVVTKEGFELSLVTNHLSGFLLTMLLLPAVRKSKALARIVFTSSLSHKDSPLDFDNLNLDAAYSAMRAYGRSKLMNLLSARELQKRYAAENIVASSFHPGAVRTAIWSKGGTLFRVLGFLIYPFMLSIREGADTLIWLASSNDEASVNAGGNYFVKRQKGEVAIFASDEAAEKLWRISEELVRSYR